MLFLELCDFFRRKSKRIRFGFLIYLDRTKVLQAQRVHSLGFFRHFGANKQNGPLFLSYSVNFEFLKNF